MSTDFITGTGEVPLATDRAGWEYDSGPFFIIEAYKGDVPEQVARMKETVNEMMQNNPELLCRKLHHAHTVLDVWLKDNAAEGKFNRRVYSRVERGRSNTQIVFRVLSSDILAASFAYLEDISLYMNKKLSFADDATWMDDEPIQEEPGEHLSGHEKHIEQIRYSREQWQLLEPRMREVWKDPDWTTLMQNVPEQSRDLLSFLPSKPGMSLGEEYLGDYYLPAGSSERTRREKMSELGTNLPSIVQNMLVSGENWAEHGRHFYIAFSTDGDGNGEVMEELMEIDFGVEFS